MKTDTLIFTPEICVFERDIPSEDKVSYVDTDLTFALHTYHDAELANWCMGNVRKQFPDCRIILLSDGDTDARLPAFAEKNNAEFSITERLMLTNKGTEFLKNRLAKFMLKPTKFLLKIDPDSGVHRRFRYLPAYDVFGNVVYGSNIGPKEVYGGFVGTSLQAVTEMLASGVLDSAELKSVLRTWKVEDNGTLLLNEDGAYIDACNRLDFEIGPFPEIRTLFKYKKNRNNRYAITHPCKDMVL